MDRIRRTCLLLGMITLLPVLSRAAAPPAITVFAAASLKESLDAVAAAWTRRSSQKVVVSYAASSALAQQIKQGAPADVFISADHEWMDELAERRQIDADTRFDLVGNRLVLIVPASSTLKSVRLDRAESVRQALGDGRLALAETVSVPAGRYARQALSKLGLWDLLSARLAQGDNVRAAMAFVARGEAALGIVYATDAKAEAKVRVVAIFPQASHDRIIYPVARVGAADARSSEGFLAFLKSADAWAIFSRAGFSSP